MRSNIDWIKDNNKKILFIGDSITYGGSIVSNNNLFSEKVCQKLNSIKQKFICGNYAVNGYSIISMSNKIQYKKFSDEEFIIITLCASDLERNFHNIYSQPFFSTPINNYLPATTELLSIAIYQSIHKKKSEKLLEEINSEQYKIFAKDNIERIALIAKKTNKKIILVYSPEKSELENKYKFFYYKDLLKKNFINFIDMSEHITNNNIYYDSIHLNVSGHELYSTIIVDFIKKKFPL